jgi:hypothetical protein
VTRDPRQFELFPVLGKPRAGLTLEELRRILHTAQVMQMNTARPARELFALGRLEVWMRGMIKDRV